MNSWTKSWIWTAGVMILVGIIVILIAVFVTGATDNENKKNLSSKLKVLLANFFQKANNSDKGDKKDKRKDEDVKVEAAQKQDKETEKVAEKDQPSSIPFTGIVFYQPPRKCIYNMSACLKFRETCFVDNYKNGFRYLCKLYKIPFLVETNRFRLSTYPTSHLIISFWKLIRLEKHPFVICGPNLERLDFSDPSLVKKSFPVVTHVSSAVMQQVWEAATDHHDLVRFEKMIWPLNFQLYAQASAAKQTEIVLCFDPLRDRNLKTTIEQFCRDRSLRLHLFDLQTYKHADYLAALLQSKLVIHALGFNTDFLPIYEAWAVNVPTLLVNNASKADLVPQSLTILDHQIRHLNMDSKRFMPVWDEKLGEMTNATRAADTLKQMLGSCHKYTPRLTMEKIFNAKEIMKKFVKIFN